MRCKDVVNTMEVGNEAISSICLSLAFSWKPLETYEYNKDEINQIACNFKSSLLTAADDGGKIIDISQKCLYKTLRAGHQGSEIGDEPDRGGVLGKIDGGSDGKECGGKVGSLGKECGGKVGSLGKESGGKDGSFGKEGSGGSDGL
ncbi:hypothetical protein F8388_000764, partial [Cannabis sativa]